MKLVDFKENQAVRSIFLVLTIILGFIFIVLFTTMYVSDAIRNNNACGCVIPIPYMILILSSLGLFVGSLSSYLLISKHLKEKKQMIKNIEFTLKFLDNDERKLITELIKNKGSLNQSEFEKLTGLYRVKIHRVIEKLLLKELIQKTSNGKVNKIELYPELKEIFV